MISELAHWIASNAGIAGPVGIVVSLLIAAYHGKHVLEAFRALAFGVRLGMVLAVVLAVLLATPAIELNLSAAHSMVEMGVDVVEYLLGLGEVLA